MKTSLPKLVIVGGKDDLAVKFKEHFDVSITRKGESYTHLIKEIPNSVDIKDYPQFQKELIKALPDWSVLNGDFLNSMYDVLPDNYSNILSKYLKKDVKELKLLLRTHPEKIHILKDDKKFIRQFWFKHLFDSDQDYYVLQALFSRS